MKRAVSCTCLALLRLGVARQLCYQNSGGLLHHHFTLTVRRISLAVCFCGPCPENYFPPGVTRQPALWSADVPRIDTQFAVTRPTWKSSVDYPLYQSGKWVKPAFISFYRTIHPTSWQHHPDRTQRRLRQLRLHHPTSGR